MPRTSTTTGDLVLEMAMAHLADMSVDNVATAGPEILNMINRALGGLFAVGAQINPAFFGETFDATYEAGEGWLIPEDAESVFRIENPEGEEVVVVPLDQQDVDPARPSVYLLGPYYRRTSQANTPAEADDLTLFYARLPVPLGAMEEFTDPLWPEHLNELLALEVAIYMAVKWDLPEQIQNVTPNRDQWLQRYLTHLGHISAAPVVRNWNATQGLPANAHALLAGGSE